MVNVVLINPFEVPSGREDDCSGQWEKVQAYLKIQPGYICMRLYKAVSSDARFRFISIAEWKSVDHYQAARESEEFRALTSGFQKTFPYFPASNEVNFIDALLLLNNCLKSLALLSIVALGQVRCS